MWVFSVPKGVPVLLGRKRRIVIKMRTRKLNLSRNQNHRFPSPPCPQLPPRSRFPTPPPSQKPAAPSTPQLPAHAHDTTPKAHLHTTIQLACNTGSKQP